MTVRRYYAMYGSNRLKEIAKKDPNVNIKHKVRMESSEYTLRGQLVHYTVN